MILHLVMSAVLSVTGLAHLDEPQSGQRRVEICLTALDDYDIGTTNKPCADVSGEGLTVLEADGTETYYAPGEYTYDASGPSLWYTLSVQPKNSGAVVSDDEREMQTAACLVTYSLNAQSESTVKRSGIWENYDEYLSWLDNEQAQHDDGWTPDLSYEDQKNEQLKACMAERGSEAWYE